MDNYNDNDLNKDDYFLSNMNSTLNVKRDYEKMEYDHEWLEKLEDVIPYIDNILRNPKRFIVNEEEVVKVELARRVTVESVIHLTQHTNLIQDIDKKTGDVKPSKILNINREESLDTYENRFIYTLINNARNFFEQRVEASGDKSYYLDKKNTNYEANTRVGTEVVKVSLTIHAVDKNVSGMEEKGLSYADRLKRIKMQLDGFTGTELYQTLSRLHVSPVRSPIRKTNVILKNPNFRKAEELWNYIQTFVSKDKKEYDKKDYFDNGALKNQYNHAALLAYIANRVIGKNGSLDSESKIITEMIQRLIENILDSDSSITEDDLKETFNKQIQNIKMRKRPKLYLIFLMIDLIEK